MSCFFKKISILIPSLLVFCGLISLSFLNSTTVASVNEMTATTKAADVPSVFKLKLSPQSSGSINFNTTITSTSDWTDLGNVANDYIEYTVDDTHVVNNLGVCPVAMYEHGTQNLLPSPWVRLFFDNVNSTERNPRWYFQYYPADAKIGWYDLVVTVNPSIDGEQQSDVFPHPDALDREFLTIKVNYAAPTDIVISDFDYNAVNKKDYISGEKGSISTPFKATVIPIFAEQKVKWSIEMVRPAVTPTWLNVSPDDGLIMWTSNSFPGTFWFRVVATAVDNNIVVVKESKEIIVLNFNEKHTAFKSPIANAFLFSGIALALLPIGGILGYMLYCSKNKRIYE